MQKLLVLVDDSIIIVFDDNGKWARSIKLKVESKSLPVLYTYLLK